MAVTLNNNAIRKIFLLLCFSALSSGFSLLSSSRPLLINNAGSNFRTMMASSSSTTTMPTSSSDDDDNNNDAVKISLDEKEESISSTSTSSIDIVDNLLKMRYACNRFTPSSSNEEVIQLALDALDVARRAPSGFNVQPYKLLLVSSEEQKAEMAKYCAGRNADRVRDSDCTAVFLADQESSREYRNYQSMLSDTNKNNKNWIGWKFWKLQFIIALFSSGYPLPRFLRVPISFLLRLSVSVFDVFFGRWIVIPTLGSAETWSTKNTVLVAASYMIACSSRGLTTCPMEGINARGVRRALNIPRRYKIPLIIATGARAYTPDSKDEEIDDVGMEHGKPGTQLQTPRYPRKDVVYSNTFGNSA
mmetsp:Transcript_42050/g.47797  ORF Transcript_42050/g.47797 Transcript_42050/m.47797 type:complete len:361 (-) Transcript_42050:5-1087(-)